MTPAEQLRADLVDPLSRIPESLRDGLVRYLIDGIKPGGFLTACIENDLLEAACRAHDVPTLLALPAIMKLLYNDAPLQSWGDKESREAWCARGGLTG